MSIPKKHIVAGFVVILCTKTFLLKCEAETVNPQKVFIYNNPDYEGTPLEIAPRPNYQPEAYPWVNTPRDWGDSEIKSVLIPRNYFLLVYKASKVLDEDWRRSQNLLAVFKNSIRYVKDVHYTPISPEETKTNVVYPVLESTLCKPQCTSNGICVLDNKGNPTCKCAAGFAGDFCEDCDETHYGPNCEKCPIRSDSGQGVSCHHGIYGTGIVICKKGWTRSPFCDLCDKGYYKSPDKECKTCYCGPSGICKQETLSCMCKIGYETKPGLGTCKSCQDGFYKYNRGCQNCWPGCIKCDDFTGKCSLCSPGMKPDNNDQRKCVKIEESDDGQKIDCAAGSFWNGASCVLCHQDCETCDEYSRCKTCKVKELLPFNDTLGVTKCANPGTALKPLQCLPEDYTDYSMVTDIYFHKLQTGVYNREKNICEPCPEGCLECHANKEDVEQEKSHLLDDSDIFLNRVHCSKCIPGLELKESYGRTECVLSECPEDHIRDRMGECIKIRNENSSGSSISESVSPEICERLGMIYHIDGTCKPCHMDCKTCDNTGFDRCTSCGGHLFQKGSRCLRFCDRDEYENLEDNTCTRCNRGCSVCLSKEICLECEEGYNIDNGICRKTASTVFINNIRQIAWVSASMFVICSSMTLSYAILKLYGKRKEKIRKKYLTWSKKTADTRIKVLAASGALKNIGIGTKDLINDNFKSPDSDHEDDIDMSSYTDIRDLRHGLLPK